MDMCGKSYLLSEIEECLRSRGEKTCARDTLISYGSEVESDVNQ